MNWLYVVLAGVAGGVVSLLLGLLVVNNKKEKIITAFTTAFAAGTLLAAAFFDLLHEAVEVGEETAVFGGESTFFIMGFALLGILFFFTLETLLSRFHTHAETITCEENCKHTEVEHKNIGIMITISDTLHNFMDGVAIAAGFLISPISGLIVTLVIMAHEIPQEIGDISVMRASGMSKKKAILWNLASSLASLVGALVFFGIGQIKEIGDAWLAPLFALVAGFFIYIATTDIIPTLHKEKNKKMAVLKMLTLIAGVVVLALLIYFLHPLAE